MKKLTILTTYLIAILLLGEKANAQTVDTVFILKSASPHNYGKIYKVDIDYIENGTIESWIFSGFCHPQTQEKCRGFFIDAYKQPQFIVTDSQVITSYVNRSLTPYEIEDSLQQYGRKFFTTRIVYLIEQKENKLYGYKMKRGEYFLRRLD